MECSERKEKFALYAAVRQYLVDGLVLKKKVSRMAANYVIREKTETSAPAEGTSGAATQAAANVVSEGGNEVQENGGNKEDDGAHEVDGNNITRRLEDQVQQPSEDFAISTDPELWGAITDHDEGFYFGVEL
ncbi:hypothetical protein G5714_004505 [Onychostoma macrolepis]|uniref:Uncharacterized protein n=1 Tax=Onychostoma macrolepis TaxID=369639 RepID=A0A7J6D508_9TELE|nr:hypothetical protein G5714_004505 [Onychostoma macrolepis]